MSQYREFNIEEIAKKMNTSTINLNDYEMIGTSGDLARVILSYSGNMKGENLIAAVAKMFDGLATPIRNSFKQLAGHSVIGFVAANRQAKPYDEKADSGQYRAIASNILMDKDDKTTWELKEGAAGKYLCRHGMEDLSELAHSVVNALSGVPRMHSIQSASVATREFVAFVNPEDNDMDYGYVLASNTDDGKLTVISAQSKSSVEINGNLVVAAVNLMGSDLKETGYPEMAANIEGDKSAQIEYYKKWFSFAPDYVQKLIDMIGDESVA
jgi:hypothetical protein